MTNFFIDQHVQWNDASKVPWCEVDVLRSMTSWWPRSESVFLRIFDEIIRYQKHILRASCEISEVAAKCMHSCSRTDQENFVCISRTRLKFEFFIFAATTRFVTESSLIRLTCNQTNLAFSSTKSVCSSGKRVSWQGSGFFRLIHRRQLTRCISLNWQPLFSN